MEVQLFVLAVCIVVVYSILLVYWAWINRSTLWWSYRQRKIVRMCLFMVISGCFVALLMLAGAVWYVSLGLLLAFAAAYIPLHRKIIYWMERRAEL